MCQFPSWFEKKTEVLFLTDKDLIAHEIDFIDGVGHSAIQKVYPGLTKGYTRHEFPETIPKVIEDDIKAGKMRKMMDAAGIKVMYLQNGKLHRENGPAIEWPDGTKEWYFKGKPHRENGPAVEYADGTKEWWFEGEYQSVEK